MTRHDMIHNRVQLCDLLHAPHDATDAALSERLNIPCGGASLQTTSFGVFVGTSYGVEDMLFFPFSTKKWRRTVALVAIDTDAALFESGM